MNAITMNDIIHGAFLLPLGDLIASGAPFILALMSGLIGLGIMLTYVKRWIADNNYVRYNGKTYTKKEWNDF